MLIAHIRQEDHVEQSVQEHLEEVAQLARQYGELANIGAFSELAGFLHDMGKFTRQFTIYLKNAVLEKNVSNEKIDHSTAGAKYLYDNYYNQNLIQNLVVETVGMAILSHHSGLQNFVQPDLKPSDFLRRVQNDLLPNYEEVVRNFEEVAGNKERVAVLMKEAKQELEQFLVKAEPLGNFRTSLTLLQKLVFSCLIDADRTNTMCFEEDIEPPSEGYTPLFETAYQTFMKKVHEWEKSDHPLNKLRNKMSENCDISAEEETAIRTLSVPTGGGKTFASLRYALKHAIQHNKSRIFYIVPYTTILEQNAEQVRKLIEQPDLVLEHHSNVIDDTALDTEPDFYSDISRKTLQLSRDNWDHPIIFTTMVQFLDAFYQKGTKKSRRLHHLINSVIIFDEVQAVPYQHHSLFHAAVNFLYQFGNSSVVFCTATQPSVDHIEPPVQLEEDAEMVPDLEDTANAFKRVAITSKVCAEGWGTEEIGDFAERLLHDSESVLIILNTKTAARKLYQYLQDSVCTNLFHLSTSMCPAHRKEILAEVNSKLGKEKVICISTQLIEAGVDISFENVIRSLAGLDSIAQAAGRCNRNAERELGQVYIIKAKDENLSRLPEIRIGAEVTANYILKNPEYSDNLLSPLAIRTYFEHFFAQAKREITISPDGLEYTLYSLLQGNTSYQQKAETISRGMWKTTERYFEAIHSPTTTVIVPYQTEGKRLIADLNEDISDISKFQKLMKHAQQYSVNLYRHELQALNKNDLLHPLYDGSVICLSEKAYDSSYGVTLSAEAAQADLTF